MPFFLFNFCPVRQRSWHSNEDCADWHDHSHWIVVRVSKFQDYIYFNWKDSSSFCCVFFELFPRQLFWIYLDARTRNYIIKKNAWEEKVSFVGNTVFRESVFLFSSVLTDSYLFNKDNCSQQVKLPVFLFTQTASYQIHFKNGLKKNCPAMTSLMESPVFWPFLTHMQRGH